MNSRLSSSVRGLVAQLGLVPGSQFSLCEPFLCDAPGKKPNKTCYLLGPAASLLRGLLCGSCLIPCGVADPAES